MSPATSPPALHAGPTRISLGHNRGPLAQLENPPSRHGARDPDDDWLVIRGRVTCPDGEWSFRDTCLLVSELRELVDWLRAPARGRVTFMEPCLEFAREDGVDAVEFLATFRGEVFPPWAPTGEDEDETVWRRGYTLTLRVTQDELNRFANALESLPCH